jgi:hypothetical protein
MNKVLLTEEVFSLNNQGVHSGGIFKSSMQPFTIGDEKVNLSCFR